jgi:integrase
LAFRKENRCPDLYYFLHGRTTRGGAVMATFWQEKYQGELVWYFKYQNHKGKRQRIRGSADEKDTRELAKTLEAEVYAIKKGWKEKPKESSKPRLYTETVNEYMDLKTRMGGHGGKPWSEGVPELRQFHLNFWQEQLKLKYLSDLSDRLADIERVIATLKERAIGGAPRTAHSYVESLRAFCNWAIRHRYLDENPIAGLEKLGRKAEPKNKKRAPTLQEIDALFSTVPSKRYLVYLLAGASGLRKRELRKLRARHLNTRLNGLDLDHYVTKNDSDVFLPLHPEIVSLLSETLVSKDLEEPLIKFSIQNIHETLDRDLKRAGIPKRTQEGKFTFHCLRVGYTTLNVENGANPKEFQEMARHKTSRLTLEVYARARQHRLRELADQVGEQMLAPTPQSPENVQNPTADSTVVSTNTVSNGICEGVLATGMLGSNPSVPPNSADTGVGQQAANVGQKASQVGQQVQVAPAYAGGIGDVRDAAVPQVGREICPENVQKFSPELASIIQRWESLPAEVQGQILSMTQNMGSGFSGFSGVAPIRPSGFSGFSGVWAA